MTTTSISLFGKEGGKLAQVYGAYVAAFLGLLAALAVVLLFEREDFRPADSLAAPGCQKRFRAASEPAAVRAESFQ
jgi:hypothetical protein